MSLLGTALLATPAILFSGNAQAAVIWNWSFGGTEAGTFTTNGTVADTSNPFTFNISGFAVTASTKASNIGATYSQPNPVQGFIWNGSRATQFFRLSGALTDQSEFQNTLINSLYVFNASTTIQRGRLEGSVFIGTTPLTLNPPQNIPEPSAVLGLLALGCLGVGSLLKEKKA